MAEITPAERARLAALLEQATPGPWEAEEGGGRGGWIRNATTREWSAMSCGETSEQATANAALIVAAVNAAPALLAALDAAEAWQRRIIDAIQPQRPEDPPAALGMDVHEAATVVAVLDGLRERARDRKRRVDEMEHALREIRALVASEVDVRDGIDGPRPNLAMEVLAVVDAALPITDAEEVVRG